MGQTPEGLWFPDRGSPIGALHTVLAEMQLSVSNKIIATRNELTAPLPTVGVVASGTSQSFPANVYTTLNGSSGGWVTTINNAAAAAAGMNITTGVRDAPITLTKAGTYTFSLHVVHNPDEGQSFSQQCYTDLGFSGSLSVFRRINWSWATVASASIRMDIPAGATLVSLRSFAAGSGKIGVAELRVWKDR